MRLTFLLDENVLYHAIRGVDRHDKPDTTAAELIESISRICHRILVHQCLLDRYNRALRKLRDYPPRSNEAQAFVVGLLHNTFKRGSVENCELPPLPPGVQIPSEDAEIVRAALISKPILVTNDSKLRDSVIAHSEALGLRAMSAQEALNFAESEPVP